MPLFILCIVSGIWSACSACDRRQSCTHNRIGLIAVKKNFLGLRLNDVSNYAWFSYDIFIVSRMSVDSLLVIGCRLAFDGLINEIGQDKQLSVRRHIVMIDTALIDANLRRLSSLMNSVTFQLRQKFSRVKRARTERRNLTAAANHNKQFEFLIFFSNRFESEKLFIFSL